MLSLYRRHRPRTFEQVVGQDHIVRTLRNAVELDKVHHAYLFVGSRGTGKTSMAKLLACALNAEGGPRTDFDPADPACAAILRGTSLDVVEMDAASNNSVDDIRELRENVALAPMSGSRRVYILDEAHMLSTAAWNAFLKTLEEPPAHVVFVLATTEAPKVPATIVDRCHRFTFDRPSPQQVAGVVERVASEEGIEIPDAAVAMIARSATGSFRDALGTLEQLVTYGGETVELQTVRDILRISDADQLFEVADALAGRDARAALLAVERLAAEGGDFERFARDLTAHLRDLVVVRTVGQVPDSLSVTAEHGERLSGQAARMDEASIVRAIEALADGLARTKDGSDPRIQLETALLKAAQPAADPSLQAFMHRIEELERGAGGAATAVPPPSGPSSAPKATRTTATEVRTTEVHSSGAATAAAAQVVVEEEVEPEPEPAQSSGPALDLERVTELWPAAIDAVRSANAMVGALLAEARPSVLDGDRLTVSFPGDASFSKRKAEAPANRDLLATTLRGLTGRVVAVAYELSDAVEQAAPKGMAPDDLLARLKEEFGAEEVFEDDDEHPTPDEPTEA